MRAHHSIRQSPRQCDSLSVNHLFLYPNLQLSAYQRLFYGAYFVIGAQNTRSKITGRCYQFNRGNTDADNCKFDVISAHERKTGPDHLGARMVSVVEMMGFEPTTPTLRT